MNNWQKNLSREFASTVQVSPLETVAEVITVVKMSEAEMAQIQAKLEQLTGKMVKVKNTIDPSIVAGMIVRTSDLVIDLSMASRLENLSRSIHEKVKQ